MNIAVRYFERPGKENTVETLVAARDRAKTLGIRQIVVASTHGFTALEAARVFEGAGASIIAVSISAAFGDQGWTMTEEERARIEAAGVTVLTAMHSLGDDVSEAFAPDSANLVVRKTLYTFGQGMKVAVECAIMAAEAGLVDMQRDLVSIAGTDEGADTASVLKPVFARRFGELRIREILAKPR